MRFSEYVLNENNSTLNEFDIKSVMKKVSGLFKKKGQETSKSDSKIEPPSKEEIKKIIIPQSGNSKGLDDYSDKELDNLVKNFSKEFEKFAKKAAKQTDPLKRKEIFDEFDKTPHYKTMLNLLGKDSKKLWNVGSKMQDKRKEISNKYSGASDKSNKAYKAEAVFKKFLPELEKKFPDYVFGTSFKPYHHYQRDYEGDKLTLADGDLHYKVQNKDYSYVKNEKALGAIKAFVTKNIVPKILKQDVYINRVWIHGSAIHFSCFGAEG